MNEVGKLTSEGNDKFVELLLGVKDEESDGGKVRGYMPELFKVDIPDSSPIQILNGRATVRVKILECSMNDPNRNFFIEARETNCTTSEIEPAHTDRIVIIRHQLRLDVSEMYSKWQDEWYKDEGGRDKAMSFKIELRNSQGELVERKLPLKIRLVYTNGNEVERQDILKVMGDEMLKGGKAEIKARIDEVLHFIVNIRSYANNLTFVYR